MSFFRKYYVYILEFIFGNIIFNLLFSIIKTIILNNIGGIDETYINNFLYSFRETILCYILIYVFILIIQISYDRYLVKTLNEKLKKQKKGGNDDE